jgi:autotransporter strand-loop-strand O-heptosyltransferase
LGWFFEVNREPVPPQTIPLQQAATNILNLPYREIIPEIDFSPSEKPIQGKYVAISTQSTAALKFWDYWQDLIDMLVARGYKVVEVSKDKTDYKNVEYVQDKSIPNVMNLIYHSEFYIGLSSGLSWLSWALHKRVYMIANFSLADHEFTTNCIRITDTSICHGCWNNPLFKFNRGDNLWCPEHEDTPQAFECHKKINATKVMKTIELNENL